MDEIKDELRALRKQLSELENWRSAHDGRINALWDSRQKQDTLDRESFKDLYRQVADLASAVRVMRQGYMIIGTIAGVVGGATVSYLFSTLE